MDRQAQLRGQAIGLLSLLGVQFILGMILNSFITLPKVHPGQSGDYFTRAVHGFGWAITNGGGIILLLHVVVAIALLIVSISLLVRSISLKNQPWTIAAVVGFLGVLAALTNGLAFLGYNKDANSFVMAMGFLFAATAYSTIVSFALRPARHAPTEQPVAEDEETRAAHHFRTSHG